MADITSKIEKLELNNGETVKLTLNFARLLYLRANGYEKEVNAAMTALAGKVDLLQMPFIFFAAYLCANKEIKYTQEQFVELVPFDLEETSDIFARLITKKKIDVSKMRSSAKHKKAR